MRNIVIAFALIISITSINCDSDSPIKKSRVVIGISADVENLNPLYSLSFLEGSIRELMFLSLVKHNWNENMGDIETSPLLAEKWEWSSDSMSIIFTLRNDIKWSDGKTLTTDDIVFSFDIYSDPDVSSTFYGGFENFLQDDSLRIILEKSFEILSPIKLKIKFKPGSNPTLFDVDVPILPKHVLSKISRKNLSAAGNSDQMVTNGPYSLSSWKKNEAIVLKAVSNSFLYQPEMINELIFKVVPDENARITQLKKGEIDLIEDISTEVVDEVKKAADLKIISRAGRDYDYIGWNNIDPELYSKNKGINPNKFFGSVNIRKALTYAINREEILKEYIAGFGQLSFGPVSPIFKVYYDNSIKPYEFNPAKAKELLSGEGWNDNDRNGILEKNNIEFSFKLFIGAGNPRRNYAATVVKNNLKAIGIDVKIETLEMSAFINKIVNRELDAYMAGWTVPIPIDLQPYWHSDFSKSPMNLSGFFNKDVDKILEALENEKATEKKIVHYKKIQKIFHELQPVTFMYWLDVKTAYNSRLDKIKINPLGAIQHCWEWRLEN